MDICKRLRQLREARGLSQGDIERRTGLLRSYVSRVEGGNTVPSVSTLEKWADALDVSLSDVFAKVPPKASKKRQLPPFETRLLDFVRRLKEKDKRQVMSIVSTMVRQGGKK